jgi:hypothetical protein
MVTPLTIYAITTIRVVLGDRVVSIVGVSIPLILRRYRTMSIRDVLMFVTAERIARRAIRFPARTYG